MRLRTIIPVLGAFLLGAIFSVGVAVLANGSIEVSSHYDVRTRLAEEGIDFASLDTDGLQVFLRGEAPDEATRFRAVALAGQEVDPTRVIDLMTVTPAREIAAPEFSIELLRNDDGVSLIGLIPAAMDRDETLATIERLTGNPRITDLLETADYPVPPGWISAVNFALDALEELPRAKISVAPDAVAITAISASAEEKRQHEQRLNRLAPDNVAVTMDISAPRPVITPFTLRFLIDDKGARFDACSAHTTEGRDRIVEAARAAGATGTVDCRLGLGVPSPRWPDAVAIGIAKLAQLGGGAITFSDADVTLVALDTAEQSAFDRVVGELEADLPDVFSLHSVLPEPVTIDGTGDGEGAPEFVATLSPEGQLQLRGRVSNDRLRAAVESFAKARFAGAEVYGAMRLDPDLPDGWSARVLASLDAFSHVTRGSVIVQPDFVEVRGDTGDADANAEIARILSGQLGEQANFSIDVAYEETLSPQPEAPSPEQCVERVNAILAARQITFDPGSANIDSDASDTVDQIADVMRGCSGIPMEIGGYTDSQGREEMNLGLSQRRAEAVVEALLARRVLTSSLVAQGYGEADPIADNETEAGREANRRIEFSLVWPDAETPPEGDAAAEGETPDEAAGTAEDGATGAPDETSGDEQEPPQDG
ncbi:OmpA family protein [Anianabacter salinae]|uniref:OmpA family protein n=1 Tax=Anianabacter salinae TaxID=2851023 RepID=UPI00225DDD82|nr:OmpA family protein [Anianabacter salinae]MBV0910899.1 OmpA family protein [Anianabacter salinae]